MYVLIYLNTVIIRGGNRMTVEVFDKNKQYIKKLANKKGVTPNTMLALIINAHRLDLVLADTLCSFGNDVEDKYGVVKDYATREQMRSGH